MEVWKCGRNRLPHFHTSTRTYLPNGRVAAEVGVDAEYLFDVVLGFFVGRDAAVFADRAGAGVVGCESELDLIQGVLPRREIVVTITVQFAAQNPDGGAEVFHRVVRILQAVD